MPVGVIVNSIAVAVGGIVGAFLGHKLPERVLKELPIIFGLSSMAMGITLIPKMANLTPIILAIILGAIIGEALKIEASLIKIIRKLFENEKRSNNFGNDVSQDTKTEMFITIIALFVFSSTGIFGVLNEGFTGDSSIMLTKSILDFFTAITFGTTIGYLVAAVAIPQFILNILLFMCAGFILPILTDTMLLDFRACGGIITMAVGLKLAKIRHFNIINILPAIVLVMPFSYLWTRFIA